jgi:hypothetical protein
MQCNRRGNRECYNWKAYAVQSKGAKPLGIQITFKHICKIWFLRFFYKKNKKILFKKECTKESTSLAASSIAGPRWVPGQHGTQQLRIVQTTSPFFAYIYSSREETWDENISFSVTVWPFVNCDNQNSPSWRETNTSFSVTVWPFVKSHSHRHTHIALQTTIGQWTYVKTVSHQRNSTVYCPEKLSESINHKK